MYSTEPRLINRFRRRYRAHQSIPTPPILFGEWKRTRLLDLYSAYLKHRQSQKEIEPSFTRLSRAVTEREKAMYLWIILIPLRSEPLNIVDYSEYRTFSAYSDKFDRKFVKKVMFKLVEEAEKRIATAMKNKKFGTMFDGWSHASIHYGG